MQRPWESCMTLSAHNAWAWGGANDGVKPLADCLKMLVSGAGGDGNVLLNVGPRPDGLIDPAQSGRLKEMGDWLTKYGESIYATRGGPFKPGKWGASTRKDKRIYVHVYQFDGDVLELPAIPVKITAARVLTGGPVEFEQSASGITLHVPAASHAAIDTLIALDIDQPALDIAPVSLTRKSASLTNGAHATASNVWKPVGQRMLTPTKRGLRSIWARPRRFPRSPFTSGKVPTSASNNSRSNARTPVIGRPCLLAPPSDPTSSTRSRPSPHVCCASTFSLPLTDPPLTNSRFSSDALHN